MLHFLFLDQNFIPIKNFVLTKTKNIVVIFFQSKKKTINMKKKNSVKKMLRKCVMLKLVSHKFLLV